MATLEMERSPSGRGVANPSNVPRELPRWDYAASGERLSAREEQELTARAQRGDQPARDRVIDANVPLVVSIARQYVNPYLDPEDLIQEGMIGLCTAVERYRGERGFRFSTYATYWIKQRVLRALDRGGRLIRVPVDVGYAARRAITAREELSVRLGRDPEPAEVAEECGISEVRLRAVLECLEEPMSLDSPVGDDMEMTLDVPDPAAVNPVEPLMAEQEHAQIHYLLELLPERDRMVLESRFGLGGNPVPLADLAGRLSMTREGVRQIQRRAILKLRRLWTEMQLDAV